MDRVACVNVPALPLQILLRRRPEWADYPAVVVDRDKPQGVIQWVNRQARRHRIVPGMRYATGLALARDLQGGVVDDGALQETLAQITERLWCFSPRVEPSADEPGVFWLDASGLVRLYPSLETWAEAIRGDLREARFHAVTAVGFTRFGPYAAAKAGRTTQVFNDSAEERAHLRGTRIERLDINPHLRDTLTKLGVETLGAFTDLAAESIPRRLGPEARRLHELARGRGWTALNPLPYREPVEQTVVLDNPVWDRGHLLALAEELLHPLLRDLAARHEELAALEVTARMEDKNDLTEHLAPATPTTEAKPLLDLLRLRLEAVTLSDGVIKLTLRGDGVETAQGQLDLFAETPGRDLGAVHQAFAKLRAELGNDAVQYAALHEGHLPEACYTWEPLKTLPPPQPKEASSPTLVRRIYTPPIELPPRARHEPDGWLVAGLADGPVDEVLGPYIVSGGWWRREVTRAYHYVRTRNGRWLWIFHDLNRRRWFLQGEVE